MKTYSSNLKRSVLVLGGIVGGLALAATMVSCGGDKAKTATETEPRDVSDQYEVRPETAAVEQLTETVVVGVNNDGALFNESDTANSSGGSPVTDSETEDSEAAGTDAEDSEADPSDDGDDDDGPVIMLTIPEWLEIIEEPEPAEPINICEKFPWLCEDKDLLLELPEACDPDEGTCPNWVIEEIIDEILDPCNSGGCPVLPLGDLVQIFESFPLEQPPIEIIHPNFLFGVVWPEY